jgi:cobalamin-dependent methionine synthase I
LELILDGDLKMIRDLRADIQGILIPGRLEIEGPVDENKTLDAVDVEEADEDGIDAEKLADMDDKELETVRMALNKQNQVKRTETIKPSPTPSPATKPNGTAVQESFELPAPERIGPGQVPASQWAEVVAYVDANMDLCTLKSDWKAQTKCEQVIRLTPSGQQNFLSFMREQAGAGFPY